MRHLFILHGWSYDPQTLVKWETVIDKIALSDTKIHLLKIPGLFTSLASVWGLDEYVAWLNRQLPQKEKIILLGHSFGGKICLKFAALHPDKVSRLIVIDSSGIPDNSLQNLVKRSLFWLAAKGGKKLTGNQTVRSLIYSLAREHDYEKANPLLKQTFRRVISEHVVTNLPHIKTPTLIIWGEHDRVTPLCMGKQINRLIPSSKFVVIKGARHSPQFTHTSEVVALLTTFLS